MTIDLLPTLARLAGADVLERPHHRRSGHLAAALRQAGREGAARRSLFLLGRELQAVRRGKWKLHLPHPYQALESAGNDGTPGKYVRRELGLSLFDLDADIGETTNVLAHHPDVVEAADGRCRARARRSRRRVDEEGREEREAGGEDVKRFV